MAEILSIAGGALLTVVFEEILKKLDLKFIRSLSLSKDILDKLKSWRSKLPKLQALLVDAEEKQMFNPNSSHLLNAWLTEVKDLAYDMEDVLDEFDIDVRRNELRFPDPLGSRASSSKFIPSCFSCFNAKGSDFIFDSEVMSKVDDIAGRLIQIEEDSKLLNLVGSENHGGNRSAFIGLPPTTSLPELHVYGRENEKAAILQKLTVSEGSSKGFSVVPILGMGGVGKTTLARLVYNEVKPESFKLKAWVCVSDKFDIPGITRTILEAVEGECKSNDLNLLQQALNNRLSDRKFLFVLDDVWNESFSLWDTLRKPFLSGAAGSKIVVTTRNKRVVEIMGGNDSIHQLQLLKDKECLSILAQHALGQETFDLHPNLKHSGEKLVKKCRGLPLAAKSLGGLLCGKLDPSEWDRISKSKIWELSENESDILPALRLSYLHLPSYLKPCFAFCAMFPKDYKFDKNKLVLLWMAGGILKVPSEEAGHRYFSELVSKAFFQQLKGKELCFYVMHDLIHDLAQFVVGEMCLDEERMLEVDERSKVNLEKVRHLSFQPRGYDVSKRFEFMKEMKSLRTFLPATLLGWVGDNHLSDVVVHDWLPKLKCLRALSLEGYAILKLSDSIMDLKCLTYLNLCNTQIESLPESMGFLIRLQSLLLRNCRKFHKFPGTIGNLIDLHHVDIRGTNSLKEMPEGMCNLKNLYTLSKLIVGKTNESLRLHHLENFSQLQGELSILDLQNVLDAEDAKKGNIGKISGLNVLSLEWTNGIIESRNVDQLQVLGWLKPHPNLKDLKIVSYGGKELASWIGDPSLSNLSDLELRNCKSCTSLPSLGLLPALQKLIVRGMDSVESLSDEFFGPSGTFPSLVELVFENMLNWKEWTCSTGNGGIIFPCLGKLEIINCPMLTGELPSHLSSLVKLVIKRCPKLISLNPTSLPSCQELEIEGCEVMSMVDLTSFTRLESLRISSCSSLKCISGVKAPTSLNSLKIQACENLEALSDGILMQSSFHESSNSLESSKITELSSLKELEVRECKKLSSSFSEGILRHCTALQSINVDSYEILKSFLSLENCLVNLERLEIFDIEGCESLPEMGLSIPNLKYLKMMNCQSIESIPAGGDFLNLSELHITGCRNLKSLLGLSTPNLKHMEIGYCPALECFPDGVLSPNLQYLLLWECDNLNSLPDTMCLLESLQTLWISDCGNLKSLPKSMHLLRSLETLQIEYCSSIECIADGHFPPSLAKLMLTNCENLKSLPNTMYELTSLQNLHINDGNLMAGWNLHSLTTLRKITISKTFPPDLVLPSSVTDLVISYLENEESIPKELFQNLSSLKELSILYCPKLQSLPKEAMPPSLGNLWINGCPLLKRQRFEAKGDHWPLTRNIPCIRIDGH